MNKKTLFLGMLLVGAIGTYFLSQNWEQIFPKQDIVSYLQERFQQQNIPVTKIIILNENPMQIEITVQSLSDGDVGTPEDSTNVLMVSREVTLADQNGYHIAALVHLGENKAMVR